MAIDLTAYNKKYQGGGVVEQSPATTLNLSAYWNKYEGGTQTVQQLGGPYAPPSPVGSMLGAAPSIISQGPEGQIRRVRDMLGIDLKKAMKEYEKMPATGVGGPLFGMGKALAGIVPQVKAVEEKRKEINNLNLAIKFHDEFLESAEEKPGWLDSYFQGITSVMQEPQKLIPIAGVGFSLEEGMETIRAAKKLEEGKKITSYEKSLIEKARAKGLPIERKWTYYAGQVVTSMMTYIAEFSLLKAAVAKPVELAVKKAVGKGVQVAVAQTLQKVWNVPAKIGINDLLAKGIGVAAQAGVFSAIRTPVDVAEKAIPYQKELQNPSFKYLYEDLGEFNWKVEATRAFGSNAVEVLTEYVGGLVQNPVNFLAKATLGKWLAKKGIVLTSKLLKDLAGTASWSGIIGEVFEEELAELLQSPIEGREYNAPWTPEGIERLLTETLGIAGFNGIARIPTTAISSIQKVKEKTKQDLIKQGYTEAEAEKMSREGGFVKLPGVPSEPQKPPVEPITPEKGVIPQELQPLATEARKYKSAEEFVSNFQKAFHGTPTELKEIGFGEGIRSRTFMGDTVKVKSGAIFFTPDKSVADFFADNRADYLKDLGKKTSPTTYERYLNIKNPLDLTTIGKADKFFYDNNLMDDFGRAIGESPIGEQGIKEMIEDSKVDIKAEDLWNVFDDKILTDKIKKLGYDGAILEEGHDRGTSYAIFNPEQAFTKQQLTDIYTQATKEVKAVAKPKDEKDYSKIREKYVSKTKRTDDYTVREPKDLYNSPVAIKYKKEGSVTFANQKINEPADVAFAFKQLKNEAVEKFYVVGLKGNRPVTVECISMGTLNASLVHPREVFGLLIKNKVDGVYFVHNHPSGDIKPSEDDLMTTKRLESVAKDFNIDYGGHIIIDGNKFGFIGKSTGLNDYESSYVREITHHKKAINSKDVSLYTKYAKWTADKPTDFEISKPEDTYELIKGLNLDKKNNTLVLHLNSRNIVITAQAIPKTALKHSEIFEQATKLQTSNIILVNTGLKGSEVLELSRKFKMYGVTLLDVIEKSSTKEAYESRNEQGFVKENIPDYLSKKEEATKAEKEEITKSIKEKLEEIEAEIWMELDTAEAGYRFLPEPFDIKERMEERAGTEAEWEGVSSSFPDWMPSHLRKKPLVNKVKDHMMEGTRPVKGSRIMELYNVVREQISDRYGEARTEILKEAGASERDVWVQELGLPEPSPAKPKGVDYKIKISVERLQKKLAKGLPTGKVMGQVKKATGQEPAPFVEIRKRETTLLKERIKDIQKQAKIENWGKIKLAQAIEKARISQEKAVRKEQLKILKTGITERIKGIQKGVREGKVTTKQEIKATQTELLGILDNSGLELADKAKFRKTIKNIQTQEQLKSELTKFQERVATLEEKATKRALKKKIINELKQTKVRMQAGKPVGRFTPEVQVVLNQLRKASKIKKSEAETIINANLEKYKNDIPPESVALENKILSMIAGMDEMAVKDLQNTLRQIQEIKATGKLTAELKKFNREADISQWNDKVVDIITGGKGIPANISTIGTAELRPDKLRDRVKKFIGTIGKSYVGWNDIIDMLARKTKAKPGTTWLDDFADVMDEENAVKKGNRTNTEQAQKMAEDTLEVKTDREMVRRFRDDANEVSLGTFKNAEGIETEIIFTKSEARKRWMELQDPSLDESFRKGMFYTDEIIKSIEDFLTPQDKAFAKAQMDFYKEYYKGVNEIYGDIYGVDLPQNEHYSPIKREGIARDESTGFGEFLQEVSVRKAVTSGSLKSRVKNIKPLHKQSDVAILEQHIAEMEHFKNWAHKIRDLKAVFGNPQTRAAIIREHGKGMLAMVDNFLNDFTRGGTELASRLSWLDKLRGNYSRAVLGIKPSIGIKQLTSFVAYADTIPVKDFGTGVVDFWRDPIKNIRTLRDQSEMMKVRGKYMERDIRTAMRSDAYASFRKKPSFLNSLMLNIQTGDQGAIYVGGWAVYKYHLKQGKSQAEAIRIFEKVSSETQQSADLSKQSYWQRGGSFAKLFTMFKSAPNQFFRKELGAVRNVVHGRTTIKQAAKTIAIYHFILPMLFQWVSDWFRWDEDEQKRAMILGPFNGIFIVGDGLDYLIRLGLDMKTWDAEIPLYSIFDDIGKSVKLIGDDDITTEDVFEAIRGLLGATGAVTGKPLKQTLDMGSGVKDVLFGEYGQGLGKILGWSPYATEKKKPKKIKSGITIPSIEIPEINIPSIEIPSIEIY